MEVLAVFERILVPVDFSDKSAKSLDAAIEMAKLHHARLMLLHVIETLGI